MAQSASYSYELQSAAGRIEGHDPLVIFGRNPDVDTTTSPEDIWNGGGLYTGFPTGAADTVDVVSDNAADTSAGTGLRTVELFGQLDGVPQSEVIILNGLTPVTSVKEWTRMGLVRGRTVGSADFNQGEITVSHTGTPATIFSVVPVLSNRSQIAAFTVELGKTAFLKNITPSIIRINGLPGSAVLALAFRLPEGVWELIGPLDISTSNSPDLAIDYHAEFPELTDIVFRVISVTDNNTSSTVLANFMLVDTVDP